MPHKDLPPRQSWFIVNMCGGRWKADVIERKRKPTKLFFSLAEAYAEAVRLADEHVEGDYAVFECIGRCVSKKKPKPQSEAVVSS